MKQIAILGANGRLGNEAVHAFHQAGYRVIAVTRHGQVRTAPKAIKRAAADAMNLRQLKKAVRGSDFILNALNPRYTDWLHMAMPMARNVMEAARSTNAIHLFPGNVYNYGRKIPALCNANTPMQADGVEGRVRIEMEKLFALAAQKYRLQTLIIRSGDFYGGSGRGSWFDQTLVERLENGQFVYPGPMDVVHSWAYLPDLAQVFVNVAERAQRCESFESLLYPGHCLTGAALKALVEQACGRELTNVAMPWKLIKLGAVIVPLWREMVELAYLWERPHRLDGERLNQLVGSVEYTPPEQSVCEALQVLAKA